MDTFAAVKQTDDQQIDEGTILFFVPCTQHQNSATTSRQPHLLATLARMHHAPMLSHRIPLARPLQGARSDAVLNSAFLALYHGFLGDLDRDRVLSALPGNGMELRSDVGHASTHISAAIVIVSRLVAPGLCSSHHD